MKRIPIIVAASIAIGSACGGCREAPPAPPAPAPEEKADATEQEAPFDGHPLGQIRQAYGLPLPPEVSYVRQGAGFIEVGTKMRVDELERFFKGRIVDYEFLRVGPHELRLVGLHATQPKIHVIRRAVRMPTEVRYTEQQASRRKEFLAQNPVTAPTPGTKITTKLAGGQDLAPGAVYGQPYTPKPGDPLYKERYRPNFGKPMGEWVLF